MQRCLSPQELAELLTNDLDEAERLDRENHLGECPTCQQALLDLSGDTSVSGYWERLQQDRADGPEPPADFLDRLKSSTLAVPSSPGAWPTVPGYIIEGVLGHGGMAVVYKARQVGLNRLVALKMILAGKHARPSVRARFKAEAVARLQHPNIVQVHEIGEHDDLPYFSMELMEGGTLAQTIARGPWAAHDKDGYRRAAELIETLARAIHHAHQQGVVHRDLKPANVLLSFSGGSESRASARLSEPPLNAMVPKITDFGLALYQDDSSARTHSGDMLGTPSYMAPEQAQGRRGDVGPATDIHALGAILFTPDNRELLALGMGGILRRWDCASGLVTEEKELPCTNEWLVPAATAAFPGDGRTLAAVSPDDPFTRKVNVMETASGQVRKVLEGHTAKVWHIACNRDGTRVATAAFGNTKDGRLVREVKVWDTTTGRVLREETSFGERTDCLALSPDGAWLAEGRRAWESAPSGMKTGPSTVFLSEVSANAPPSLRPPDGDSVVRGLAFSSDGRYLAAARESGTIRVWDQTGHALHEQPMQGPPGMSALAFSPDGSRLAGVSRERVQVWDVASGQDMLFLTGAEPRSKDNGFNPVLGWSPDGSRLAASNWNRVVSVWETADPDSAAVRADRRRRAAARAFPWHRDRAESAAGAGASFALAFHRRRLEALEPPTARLRRERTDFFIRCGAWDQARADLAVDFAKGIPERANGWRDYALLLMQTDGRAEYERLRSLALKQFADSDDSSVLRQLVRSSGLTPLAAPEAAHFLRAARQDRTAHPNDTSALTYLGLALCRAGQWEEASRCLHQSIDAQGKEGTPALAWITLALVHLRQGHPEQAKPWLAKVDPALPSKALAPATAIAPPDWDWQAWLEIRLLRREAESLRSSIGTGGR